MSAKGGHVLAIMILTLADLLLTWWGLSRGCIIEGNPFLVVLFDTHPVLAVSAAFTWTLLLVYTLTHLNVPWIYGAFRFLVAIKIVVVALHLSWVLPSL